MAVTVFSRLKGELKVSSPVFRHAVRAAVAITIAIAAAKNLNLSHAVWIPISVIVVMRPSLGGTLQISWKRFAGTVIGAVAGMVLIGLKLPYMAIICLIPLLSFFMFYFKPRHFIAFTTTLTLCVVLILGTVFSHTWQGGLERILDTFLGISFGLGASFLIWPNFSRKNLRRVMVDLIESQHEHFKSLREIYFCETKEAGGLLPGRLKAAQNLDVCSEKFRDASVEPGLKTTQRQELLHLIDIFARIHRVLIALSSTVNKSTGVFQGNARKGYETLMDAVDDQFSLLKLSVEKGETVAGEKDFFASFNAFMAYLGQLRSQGEFEGFTLDRRSNSSAFLRQINRLGTELIRAKKSIEALRKKS